MLDARRSTALRECQHRRADVAGDDATGRPGVSKRLRAEARKLAEHRTDTLLIEPRRPLSGNLMARGRRNEVMAAAHYEVSDLVRTRRAQLEGLSEGHPYAVVRPVVEPDHWGSLREDVLASRPAPVPGSRAA